MTTNALMKQIKFLKYAIIVHVYRFRCFGTDFEDDGEDESDGGWQQEIQRRYAQEATFMAELRARHPSSPGEVPQSGQQQGYTGQTLPTCEEYVEKHPGNGDLNLGPFGPQVNIHSLLI